MLGREPAAIAAFIQAVIALGVGFGLQLTPEQIGLIMAVVTLGLGLVVRQVVTPTASPQLDEGTEVRVAGTDRSVTV